MFIIFYRTSENTFRKNHAPNLALYRERRCNHSGYFDSRRSEYRCDDRSESQRV